MANKLKILLLFLLVDLLFAYPIQEDQQDPGEYGDYFEGDMELDEEQMRAILYNNQRNVKRNEKYRWPGNSVFYEIDSIFGEKHIHHIHKALREIEKVTCIKFIPRQKHTKAYITVTGNPTGCHASVGYRGKQQNVNLHINEPEKGCFRLGTIMHEFIHALGFHHQQCATNRDDYITVVRDNIKETKLGNFIKYPATEVTDYGLPYDYGSIMHYGRKAFSKNKKDTIIPHDKSAKIGQREGLSPIDIKKLNIMYKCAGFY